MIEPRLNVYTCRKCKRHTVTVDVDEGVTPFLIQCRQGPRRRCTGMAVSSFYPRGPKPPHIGEPQWEWYKPSDEQLNKLYFGDVLDQMREHVEKGGLDLRARTKAAPIMHKD
jgi:hypothetical protein